MRSSHSPWPRPARSEVLDGDGRWVCVLVGPGSGPVHDASYVSVALDDVLGCGAGCAAAMTRRAWDMGRTAIARGSLDATLAVAVALGAWGLTVLVERRGDR